MNYQRIYNEIISRRSQTPYIGYTEKHHIIPRSLGGSDDKSNLIQLSAREHFICHLLLVKIHPTGPNHYKMIRAFLMMLVSGDMHNRFSPSRSYQHLKEEYSSFLSATYIGSGNSQYGTRWVSNPDTGSSLKIKTSDIIPAGFYIGRNLKWKRCPKCNANHLLTGALCETCKSNIKNKVNLVTQKPPKLSKETRKIEKTCAVCGSKFLTYDHTFCSLKCSKTNGNAAVARGVEDDLGNIFNTLTEAAKYYDISVEGIRYRIKTGKYRYL